MTEFFPSAGMRRWWRAILYLIMNFTSSKIDLLCTLIENITKAWKIASSCWIMELRSRSHDMSDWHVHMRMNLMHWESYLPFTMATLLQLIIWKHGSMPESCITVYCLASNRSCWRWDKGVDSQQCHQHFPSDFHVQVNLMVPY